MSASTRRGSAAVVVALVVVAVVLLAAGFVLLATRGSASDSASANRALVDPRATAQVVGQVDTALDRVLTYHYDQPAATRAAASQMLVGDAASEYAVLFKSLESKAAGEKLTLSAQVVRAGVTSLHGNKAELLVFVDQTSTRAADGQSSTSAAQLRIAALRKGDVWRISELVPL